MKGVQTLWKEIEVYKPHEGCTYPVERNEVYQPHRGCTNPMERK